MRDTTAALKAWLAQGGRRIGQIALERAGAGWSLQHEEDAGRSDLAPHTRWQDARGLANLDDVGGYRALKTAPTLRHGWQLTLPGVEEVRRALDYFYPAMLGVWLAHQQGALSPVCLRETLGRQTGMYRVTQKLTDAEAQELIPRTCSDRACLKTVLWRIAPDVAVATLPPEKFAVDAPPVIWPLLCQEPCNFLVAAARKAVKGEATE
jgi:sirohydrochlorin cobaltochelatase